jgi:hypothetical protein
VTKKPPYEQYQDDIIKELGFSDFANAERSYAFNLRVAQSAISACGAMAGFVSALKDMSKRYAGGRSSLLFYPSDFGQEIRLLTKPFASVVQKLYRSNVVFNRQFPNPSRQGYIVPRNLYEQVDDLVRGRIVCKYMDGPRFVCQELERHCNSVGLDSSYRELSTDAGYYAWHFYFRVPVELALEGGIEEIKMWVEIQISTQLAEVLTALTHELYETRRLGRADQSWKWDAASREFRSAYLGHGLHLLEGIIQNLKDDLLARPAMENGQPTVQCVESIGDFQDQRSVPIEATSRPEEN